MSDFINVKSSENVRCVLGQAVQLLDLEDEANTFLPTSGTIIQRSTRRNFPKELNSEEHLCQNLKSRVIFHVVQTARPK
jgi:hypothetical protein